MRFLLPLSFLTTYLAYAESNSFDWSQPPMECIEETVPRPSRKKCPDLSQVVNPSFDFPANMTESEKKLWTTTYAKDLKICRANEIVRREDATAGSVTPVVYQYAWMRKISVQDALLKRKTVSKASAEFKIPQTLLAGALLQESYFANLGIVNDGGNYSCGLGQLNPLEWCSWMESLPASDRAKAGWPNQKMALWKKSHPGKNFCTTTYLPLSLMQGYYKRAVAKLGALPEYRLEKKHFQGFKSQDIIAEFPVANGETQSLRYAALTAFINNCNNVDLAIRGKAKTLADLFNAYVPQHLKESQVYERGETYKRQCSYTWKSPYYPAHPGWLLAIAIYNTGPRAADMIRHYEQWSLAEYNASEYWETSTPQDLVDTLYWAGRYNPQNDLIEYRAPGSTLRTIPWSRQCITQRHVSRTLANATLPGFSLAKEWSPTGCPSSIFDSNGNLVESKVPQDRRASSGQR